jgi:excisionase family DNA binding protein
MPARKGGRLSRRGRCRPCGAILPAHGRRSACEQRANLDALRLCPECYAARLLTPATNLSCSLVGGERTAHPTEGIMLDAMTDLQAGVFTKSEAARALRISTSYVEKLEKQGKARRSIRTAGGRLLFSREDVAEMARAINRSDRLDPEAA